MRRSPQGMLPVVTLLASLACAAAPGRAGAAALAPAEEARIEYLITAIAQLPAAQFIRNGAAYDGKAATEHLRLKLRFAGAHVHTAEDFIRYCGSVSSTSGEPYTIRFADGRVVPSGEFLSGKLREYDRQRAPQSRR